MAYKKKKKHKRSVLQDKDGMCYLCIKLNNNYKQHRVLHEHHVFGGANRSHSESEGLKVYLCVNHHVLGVEAVHNNHKNMRMIQEDAQKVYEETHTREEFIKLFGKNYIAEEKDAET